MKRFLLLSVLFILVLGACNTPEETSHTDKEEVVQNKQVEESSEDAEDTVENEDEPEETGEEVSTEDEESDDTAEESEEVEEEVDEQEQNTEIESNEKEESDRHQEIIDLTYEIFDAQDAKDYEFLESVISEGTELDKENNKFVFENVTYPHEQEFFTEDKLGELEFRYTHEESESSVIVGFGAVDYENESSFVIDFEFIQENGKWKMNDMDVNK